MNSLTIEKIIMSHLLTLPNFDKSKVARVNHNFTPPVTGVWYRVNITGGVNTVACINDTPCTREIGTLIIQYLAVKIQARQRLNKRVMNWSHFAYFSQENLELLTPSIIFVGVDNGFCQYNVSVPYWYN
ncbi:hypothetical protein [Faucicola boevrei]|uniref:hypothetical protein n=1 Tax=Faucicola boevrei TaxID=346665 RepID=UPI00035DC77A|nr:hypothetical protein [Moraxella boevrei]